MKREKQTPVYTGSALHYRISSADDNEIKTYKAISF